MSDDDRLTTQSVRDAVLNRDPVRLYGRWYVPAVRPEPSVTHRLRARLAAWIAPQVTP